MANLFAGTPLPGRYDRVEKADTSGVIQAARVMDIRDRELQRRFERAEAQKRADINAASGFDAASLGQGAEGFYMLVNDAVENMSSGDYDAVQSAAMIANLRSQYDMLKAHSEGIKDAREMAEKAAKGDPTTVAQIEGQFGIGEELNYNYSNYVQNLDDAMNNLYVQGSMQVVDGQLTGIDRVDGVRKPLNLLTGYADGNYWFPVLDSRRPVDVGDLDDWAKSKEAQDAILFSTGAWREDEAIRVYNDNIYQISEEGKRHRLQVLAMLEENNMINHLTPEKRRQFRDGVGLTEDIDFITAIEKGRQGFVSRSKSAYELSSLADLRRDVEKEKTDDKYNPKTELNDAMPYKGVAGDDLSGVTFLGKEGRQLSDDEVLTLTGGMGPFSEGVQLPGLGNGWTYPMRSLKNESINILNPDYVYITEDPVDGTAVEGKDREPNGPQVLMNLKLDETTWLEDGSLLIKNATDKDGRRISDIYLDAERNADIIVKVIQAIKEAYNIPVTAEELGTGKAREYSGLEVIQAVQPRVGRYDNF
jgi:hypothetical protein